MECYISFRTSWVYHLVWWWLIPLISALGRQRRVHLYEFEATLIYIVWTSLDDMALSQPGLHSETLSHTK